MQPYTAIYGFSDGPMALPVRDPVPTIPPVPHPATEQLRGAFVEPTPPGLLTMARDWLRRACRMRPIGDVLDPIVQRATQGNRSN